MQQVFPAVVLTSQGRRWSIFSPVDTFSLLFEANQPTKAPTLGRSEASKTLSKIFYFRFFLYFFLLWSKNAYCVSFSSSSLSSFLSFARIKIRFKSFVFFSARKSAPVRFWNAHILDFRVGWKFSSSGCNKAGSDSIPFYFERFRSKSETSSSVSTTRQQCQLLMPGAKFCW